MAYVLPPDVLGPDHYANDTRRGRPSSSRGMVAHGRSAGLGPRAAGRVGAAALSNCATPADCATPAASGFDGGGPLPRLAADARSVAIGPTGRWRRSCSFFLSSAQREPGCARLGFQPRRRRFSTQARRQPRGDLCEKHTENSRHPARDCARPSCSRQPSARERRPNLHSLLLLARQADRWPGARSASRGHRAQRRHRNLLDSGPSAARHPGRAGRSPPGPGQLPGGSPGGQRGREQDASVSSIPG